MIDKYKLVNNKGLLYTRIADSIRNYIVENQLKQGDKLPSERRLCEQLKSSRHCIREALRVLENQGIISVQVGKGSYVEQESVSQSIYMQFVKVNFLDLLEIKYVLEKQVLSHAIDRLHGDDLDKLDGYAQALIELKNKGIYGEEIDIAFHSALAAASPNTSLKDMIASMISTFTQFWRQLGSPPPLSLIDTIPLHQAIVDGIRERNPEKVFLAHRQIYEIDVEILKNYNI